MNDHCHWDIFQKISLLLCYYISILFHFYFETLVLIQSCFYKYLAATVPEFIQPLKSVTCIQGKSGRLEAVIRGQPTPNVTWWVTWSYWLWWKQQVLMYFFIFFVVFCLSQVFLPNFSLCRDHQIWIEYQNIFVHWTSFFLVLRIIGATFSNIGPTGIFFSMKSIKDISFLNCLVAAEQHKINSLWFFNIIYNLAVRLALHYNTPWYNTIALLYNNL